LILLAFQLTDSFRPFTDTSISIPILAIVDGDPHGLDILRIYKYGGTTAVELALLDRIEWAGVKGSECSE